MKEEDGEKPEALAGGSHGWYFTWKRRAWRSSGLDSGRADSFGVLNKA
jgi:hypothetical protein